MAADRFNEVVVGVTCQSKVDPESVGNLAVQGAQPLRDNRFKVRLAASLVARALSSLLGLDGAQ